MPRLARLLTTLPVVILPLVVRIIDPASASALSVEQGLHVLAKSKAIDSKCGILVASERRELSGYLARAEVASQNMIGGSAANAAVINGRAAGKSAKCGPGARHDVEETLEAARLAVAQVDGIRAVHPRPAGKPEKPNRYGQIGPVSPAEYRTLTQPYFVDLRCKQLSGRKARLYYEAIRDLQQASIAKHGTAAIAGAQARTRKVAQGITCGPASRKLAEQGLAAILQK